MNLSSEWCAANCPGLQNAPKRMPKTGSLILDPTFGHVHSKEERRVTAVKSSGPFGSLKQIGCQIQARVGKIGGAPVRPNSSVEISARVHLW